MLVLTRKHREAVVIGEASSPELLLKITVLEIRGGTVKLGFEGDRNTSVRRLEVWEKSCGELPVPPPTDYGLTVV